MTPLQQTLRKVAIEDSIIYWVREGFVVYDVFNEKMGTVDAVHIGGSRPEPALLELPHEVAEALSENGYVKVRASVYSPCFYVFPYQIADLSQQAVFLHVPHRDIIQV